MHENTNQSGKMRRTWLWWIIAIFTRLILPAAIIVVAIMVAQHLIATSPQAPRQRPPRQARLVEVVQAETGSYTATISALGTVMPAREVELKPQVAGQIIDITEQLIPGGLFKSGDPLMKIDPCDYRLVLEQRQSDVDMARSNLRIEQGNQAVARQEYELLGDVVNEQDQDLILRRPQLASLQSRLEAAQSQLRQARLNLSRTQVDAPFNAIVKEKYVDLGAMVSSATPLVRLAGTDAYWVELAVPVDQLSWISIPQRPGQTGSVVRIYNPSGWPEDSYRQGRILRLIGELEPTGRMARVLVEIDDPLALKPENAGAPILLVNAYIRAEIEGKAIESAVKLDRQLLRDGNHVWLYAPDGTLRLQPVKIIFRAEEFVYVDGGLSQGDQIVVTDLAAPVEGMPLRLPGAPSPAVEPQTQMAQHEMPEGDKQHD